MPQLTEPQLKRAVDETFKKYDTDNNGKLDKDEIIPMLQDAVNFLGKSYKVEEFDVKGFMNVADINHNKKLERK